MQKTTQNEVHQYFFFLNNTCHQIKRCYLAFDDGGAKPKGKYVNAALLRQTV